MAYKKKESEPQPKPDLVFERGLPAAPDAEKYILAGIVEGHTGTETLDLASNDFSLESHRRIFAAVLALRERRSHVDRVTITNYLHTKGELESVGGLSYLISLSDGMPEISNLKDYAKIVREKSVLRQTIFYSQSVIDRSLRAEDDATAILEEASAKMDWLSTQAAEETGLQNPGEIMEGYPGGVNEYLKGSVAPAVPFGFPQVDALLIGLQESAQYVIGGYTSSGKSAFAGCVASNLARNCSVAAYPDGIPVAVFSIEMPRELYLARVLCAAAQVNLGVYSRRQLDADDRRRIMRAAAEIKDMPLYIDESTGMTIPDFARKATKAILEKKVRVVMLDYMQIVDWEGENSKFQNEYQAMTYLSKVGRLLSRKYKISTVFLSQLNRPKKGAESERPVLSSLKMSGSIENDATGVVLMYREEVYKPRDMNLKGKAEALVRKSRNGSIGTAHLEFKGRFTQFIDEGKPGGSDDEREFE